MSLWSKVRSLFGENTSYTVVWREQVPGGALMRGEPISGNSDTDAISLVALALCTSGTTGHFGAVFVRTKRS